jgi:hypothetical protein
MQCVLYVRDSPRALALQPSSHNYSSNPNVDSVTLVFEGIRETYDHSRPQCNVTLVKDSKFDVSEYRRLTSKHVYGCLGLLQVEKGIANKNIL